MSGSKFPSESAAVMRSSDEQFVSLSIKAKTYQIIKTYLISISKFCFLSYSKCRNSVMKGILELSEGQCYESLGFCCSMDMKEGKGN